ncbi:hypothetical protein IHE44_0013462 [Lamprotornis superbus]|uniref:Anion exchange protein n=1 Tax=Lamprotornis superbus TaxID=245042 RepID=A0A835NLG3_9PASS|nr:hypothetical protein IHE44_0013462 [Lamprotornis superbus]
MFFHVCLPWDSGLAAVLHQQESASFPLTTQGKIFLMEDEAVLDRGASFLKHVCDEEEVEGHHTIYIGVHVPKSYRRRRRHRRRPGHKEKKEKEKISENYSDKSDVENADETSSSILKPLISPAAERIRFILGEEDDSPAPPQLFTELDELLAVDGQEMEWKETARWIKFEEKVEQGGERWSKPHVATLSLHSLFELRTCIEKGSIMLDMEASSLPQVVEMIVDNQIETGLLKSELKDKVTYTLLRKHRHQTKKSNLRSLADIGKTVSSASRMFSNPDNARSPLESSVPCLATRTLDDELGVQRSPSVGWLSKCWAGLWVGRLGARTGTGARLLTLAAALTVGSGAALAVQFIPLSPPLLCFILFSFLPSSGMMQADMTRGSLADPRGAHCSSQEGTAYATAGTEVFFGGHSKPHLNSRVFPLTDYCGADSQDEIIAWRGLDCLLYFSHKSLAEQAMNRLRSPLPERQEWELGLDQEIIPRSPAMAHRNLTSTSLNDISDKPEKDQLKNKFMKKLPRDAEASNVLVGEVDFLESPFIAFVRLQQAVMLGALTEVPVPTRFLFILLGPKGKAKSYHEIGRAIATLMSDEVFHDIAYKAKDRQDLIAGIDEFLDEVIVLPPGEWDPAIRIEPPKSLPSSDKRKNMYSGGENLQMNGDTPHDGGHGGGGHGDCEELQRTGRFCGGLIKDIKRKAPFFASDFYDALNIQALSAILFIYLATVTNAITFGGLLGDATENMQGVLESFLGTAVTGAIFCLLAGQPLTILSSTGPVLVFERLLFNFSKDNDFDYLEFRLWIGLWSAFQCLILVATDASFLVKYFTRFTEEGFSSLISFIFIYDAFKKMIKLADHYPINSQFKVDYITHYSCACKPLDPVNSSLLNRTMALADDELVSPSSELDNTTIDWAALTAKECLKYGGQLVGNNCDYVPDITLMSFILFFGTYTCSMALKKFKTSRYFPTTARKLISDFAIILSILIFCGIDALVGVDTPKLIVPSEFKPTSPERGWFIPPFGGNPWWVYLAAAIPALLVTILIFMDQQITAVIVNRKEHKLKGLVFAPASFLPHGHELIPCHWLLVLSRKSGFVAKATQCCHIPASPVIGRAVGNGKEASAWKRGGYFNSCDHCKHETKNNRSSSLMKKRPLISAAFEPLNGS